MCSGIFGLIFGHCFRPRHNTAELNSGVHHPPPSPEELQHLMDASPGGEEDAILTTYENMLRNGNDTTEAQYVCDVCERCGQVVRP